MYYPDEIIEEVRRRSDIVDIIGSYVKLTKKGSNYQGLCPFHNEKTPSFSVSGHKQIYKCFGCGKAGNVITFVMEYENMQFGDALKLLADRAGVKLPEPKYSEETQRNANMRAALHDMYKTAAIYYHSVLRSPAGADGYKYLKGRQLSDETIVKFGLGYSPKSGSILYKRLKDEMGYKDDILKSSELFTYTETHGARDKFWNRVMFPIMDINNKVIAFGGRVMGDGTPKYLNSNETKIFEKSKNLYALNIARRSRAGYLLLCEGYMDVISLHQAGFDNAVASLGTALTGLQANLMSRYTKNVVITYDSDGAGTKAALRAIPILKAAGISAKVLRMAPYKDPDDFIKALGCDEYQKRIDEAQPAFFFELSCLAAGYDMDNPEEKTRFINEVGRKMLEYTDEIERTNYSKAFCKHYDIPYDEFKKLVNRLAAGMSEEDSRNYSFNEGSSAKNSASDSLNRERLELERLLLTWSMEKQKYCDMMREWLDAEDFQEGIPRKIAVLSYEQAKHNNGKINPASLVNHFETAEEQMVVSDLFQTELWEQMEDDSKVRDKAFAETLGKVLDIKNKQRMEEASKKGDQSTVMKCMVYKKEISSHVKTILSRLAE